MAGCWGCSGVALCRDDLVVFALVVVVQIMLLALMFIVLFQLLILLLRALRLRGQPLGELRVPLEREDELELQLATLCASDSGRREEGGAQAVVLGDGPQAGDLELVREVGDEAALEDRDPAEHVVLGLRA